MRKDEKQLAKTFTLAGRVAYLMSAIDLQTQQPACLSCGKLKTGHDYGNGWCSECLHANGFLPNDYASTETWMIFRPLFAFASGIQAWESLRALVWRFNHDRVRTIELLTLDAIRTGQYVDAVGCLICHTELGDRALGGCCSRPCYAKYYRQVNAAKVKAKREERQKRRKELEAKLLAEKSPD